ncbi:centromere-associated protein E-like [Sabethes cyaneus]|uniref:centromere-associated protein E-like n=1 Tax=Sabethes cyaneus TaxID=53552 RepID=UPI00237DF207|nr:centromere-associated protein E-like [Sabethes cyaneus]
MDTGPVNPSIEDGTVAETFAAEDFSPAERCHQEGGDCGICGEPRQLTADLAEKMNLIFEKRLLLVEKEGGDAGLKIELYQDWIRELRTINISVIEAIRVMQSTCQRHLNRMNETHKRNLTKFGRDAQARLLSDRDSLLEVIRRARTTGRWDIEGIKFFDISIEDIFGKKTGEHVELQNDGPSISVNLAVSSHCQLEDISQIDDLRQELIAKQKRIDDLEIALGQTLLKTPSLPGSIEDSETEFIHGGMDCGASNKEHLQHLRQLISHKNEELEQQSFQIERLNKLIEELKNKFDDTETQLELELTRSFADIKLEDSAGPNRKVLQQLQNLARAKSDQLEAAIRDNEALRSQVAALNGQLNAQLSVDNQSLVNEISIHYDENRRLKKKLLDVEQSLNEANAVVKHRNAVISQLRQEIQILKKNTAHIFDSNAFATDSISLCSSESVTSFGSAHSDSSIGTVVRCPVSPTALRSSLDRLSEVSEFEMEQVQRLKIELAEMGTRLQELQSVKQAQDEVIAQQSGKLHVTESEYKILRDEYENHEKRLLIMRTEILRLIKILRETTKDVFPLPQNIAAVEELVPQTFTTANLEDLSGDIFQTDKLILGSLQQHFNSITRHCLLTIAEQKELRRDITALQHDKRKQADLIENLKNGLIAAERASQLESQRIADQAESCCKSPESFAAQRVQMQNVLRAVAEEIAYLLGKDLPDDTLSSFSELDATPLHCLIENLKQEIEAKDSLLQGKADTIVQLEETITSNEKELYRLKLRQDSVERERLSCNKRIENLQRALQDHDETIGKLKQQNQGLELQIDDMKETLHAYKENIQRTIEEKSRVEDECKNQLVTISNLRTALEETKRNSSSSVNHLREVIETLHLQVSMLGEQLNHAFRENVTKDSELEQYRDSNLQLRCQISELTRDSIELKDLVTLLGTKRELAEQKQRYVVQMKNELNGLQAQMVALQKEIDSRQRDRDYLSYFRKQCAEMAYKFHLQDMEHQQELQRLRDEIESLSVQLVGCSEQAIHHEQWLQESNALQNTITELERHNEIFQKNIQSYEDTIEQQQQELSAVKFQYDNLTKEVSTLTSSCSEKDSKIISLNTEKEKLLADLSLHKRMCKCGFNNSLKERSKTPVSHSLQKQVVQKTLEATKAADALKQKTVEFKKLETKYVEERIRLTEQSTELFTQIGKLKGKNSNLEQTLFHKEELIERLQQTLRDVNQRLAAKSEAAHNMETKNANLSQLLEKFREDSTVREKKLTEELNSIRRSTQDHRNQLQHCENQLANQQEELHSLRDKADDLLKERDTLREQVQDFSEKLECASGKESALCEVLKKLQEDLSFKTKRLAEVEGNYRDIYQAYQNLKGYNEDLAKQSQLTRTHLDNYRKLVEFKRQTMNTLELAQKCADESQHREQAFQQKIEEQKRLIVKLREDRVKMIRKLYDYHRDSVILNQKLENYQQIYSESRRTLSTSLHQPFYPEAYKLVRSNSDPACKENDELIRKMEFTRSRIHQTREIWQQGMQEILSPK